MDDILDETAAHWDTLTQAQKVAFAETVGGVRQYTNLIALMDNWDKMQTNVGIAANSEGTLQEQADIYAESWEAASKRLKAALESVYDDLLDDGAFISLTNGLTNVIKTVDGFIDSIGGLKTLLPMIGSILLSVFGSDLSASIDNIRNRIIMTSEVGRQEALKTRQEFIEAQKDMIPDDTIEGAARRNIYSETADIQSKLLEKTYELKAANKELSEEEQAQVGHALDLIDALGQEYVQIEKNI